MGDKLLKLFHVAAEFGVLMFLSVVGVFYPPSVCPFVDVIIVIGIVAIIVLPVTLVPLLFPSLCDNCVVILSYHQ